MTRAGSDPRRSAESARARRAALGIRDATPADNAALVALAAACPMQGDLAMCVDRAPDFFALNRLEGERWRVGVAEAADGRVVGCIAVAERRSYLHGRPTTTAYVSDFKVHPKYRGRIVADALTVYAREACLGLGPDVPTVMTVLAGNRAMERGAEGPRGLPRLDRVASLEALAVPLLWPRRSDTDLKVSTAALDDVAEMAELWAEVAAERELSPVLDAESLARFVSRAPGLHIGDYLVARRLDGRIIGFVGLWDQRAFKQLRVTGYSPRLGAARLAVNALAPLVGAVPLPRAGEPLRTLAAVHLCAPGDRPEVLRSLLLHAHARHRRGEHSFMTVALDRRDPLRVAFRGLFAQPTRVDLYVTTPSGRPSGVSAGAHPVHFEAALV